jgi:hypothetical protein
MSVYGRTVRNVCVVVGDLTILAVFPCHSVESPWFWGAVAGLLGLSSLIIMVLELIRFLAPDFADRWWAPD